MAEAARAGKSRAASRRSCRWPSARSSQVTDRPRPQHVRGSVGRRVGKQVQRRPAGRIAKCRGERPDGSLMRRYATRPWIVASVPWDKSHGYRRNVATRRDEGFATPTGARCGHAFARPISAGRADYLSARSMPLQTGSGGRFSPTCLPVRVYGDESASRPRFHAARSDQISAHLKHCGAWTCGCGAAKNNEYC